jgi:hypothetical protein
MTFTTGTPKQIAYAESRRTVLLNAIDKQIEANSDRRLGDKVKPATEVQQERASIFRAIRELVAGCTDAPAMIELGNSGLEQVAANYCLLRSIEPTMFANYTGLNVTHSHMMAKHYTATGKEWHGMEAMKDILK